MPRLSGHVFGIFIRMQVAYFRMVGEALAYVRLQGPEVESDPFQRGGIQGLVAEENHQVRGQRIVQVLKLGVIQADLPG